jgi:hypothetical protein
MQNPIIVAADIVALRKYPSATSKQLAFLTGSKALYCFDGTLTTPDDGGTFIKPSTRSASQKGRWVLDNSSKTPGARAVNVLRVASNVADTETVTIGADVYEFDRAADGVTAGRIAVTGHADDTPAAATDALIAKINASGTEAVTAVDISANEILIVANKPGAVVLACTETLGGANNAWAAAAMYGGAVPGPKKRQLLVRVPTAVEVAVGNLHFEFDFTPTKVKVDVRITATPGIAVAWDGAITITGGKVTLGNGGSVDWSASHDVWVEASE